MNVEAFDMPAAEPMASLPAALSLADFAPPAALTNDGEPTPVVILIEVEFYSGAG